MSAGRSLARPFQRLIEELTIPDRTDNLIWHRPDENPHKALAMIDQALGIEVAD